VAQRRAGDSTDTVAALRHLAGVLLHGPSVRARTLAREGRGDEFVAALDALYGIAPEAVIHPLVTPTTASEADDLAV
jgi:glutamyl-tRNA reductase